MESKCGRHTLSSVEIIVMQQSTKRLSTTMKHHCLSGYTHLCTHQPVSQLLGQINTNEFHHLVKCPSLAKAIDSKVGLCLFAVISATNLEKGPKALERFLTKTLSPLLHPFVLAMTFWVDAVIMKYNVAGWSVNVVPIKGCVEKHVAYLVKSVTQR